jgi:hypothetical protein
MHVYVARAGAEATSPTYFSPPKQAGTDEAERLAGHNLRCLRRLYVRIRHRVSSHLRTAADLSANYFLHRVINGVKDTAGFRETFLNESKHSGNGSREESVRESTLLVNTPPHTVAMIL